MVYVNQACSFKGARDGQISLENPWGRAHPLPMTPTEFKQLVIEVHINRA